MLVCPQCAHEWEPVTKPLTLRQAEIRDYILLHQATKRCAPSQQEIADRFGFRSLATVHEHLTNLERKGWITRHYNTVRAIEVVA